jgi:hypothetical protein
MKDPNWRPIDRLFGIIMLAAGILAAYSGIHSIASLQRTNEEDNTARLCVLPSDIIYNYRFISNTQGASVADFWLTTTFNKEDFAATLKRYSAFGSGFEEKIMKANTNNYNLQLAIQSPRDKGILAEIEWLKGECSESLRRENFSERFKDFLRYLGLFTLSCLAFWLTIKIGEKVQISRK